MEMRRGSALEQQVKELASRNEDLERRLSGTSKTPEARRAAS
jgi:hypothetical protein